MNFEAEQRLIENDEGIQRSRRENHPAQVARDCGLSCMECVIDLGLAIFFPVYEWCCKPWNLDATQRRSSYGNLAPESDLDMHSEISFQPLIDDTGDQAETLNLGYDSAYVGPSLHGTNSKYHKQDPVFAEAELGM